MTQPGVLARAIGAVHRAVFGLPPGGRRYTIERAVPVPTADGAQLLTDLYLPVGEAHGTVLIRTPYGRGLPESLFHGRAFAERGYQVVIQSVRGTAGSTGALQPIAQETADGQDAVAWLRGQAWFTGRLATVGGSYLGWSQWALLQDPPPELRAAVVLVGPHNFARAIRGTGSPALADFLGWSATVPARGVRAMLAARRRVDAALCEPTPEAAAVKALGPSHTWFTDWLAHPDLEDPFWTPYDASAALSAMRVPVLLIGGWHDVFVDQTLEQYRRLDTDVALTIGPWTHLDTGFKASRVTDPEALAWFDQHLAGAPSRRPAPVRIYVTGAEEWRSMSAWPPKTEERVLGLTSTGGLGADSDSGTIEFPYDPADPTPSVGGRHMSANAGRQDNGSLEARDDVVTFTSTPLDAPLEVLGAPSVRLEFTATTAPDLFVRLCEVDERGRSWNVTEVFTRLTATSGPVTLSLGTCAHRFAAGHRLRVQVSGGAYPRFARNPEPCDYTISCAGSRLMLPVAPG